MNFIHQQIQDMGALFYLNGQVGTVACSACQEGQVDFRTVGAPALTVQSYQLICDKCGRTGRHPN